MGFVIKPYFYLNQKRNYNLKNSFCIKEYEYKGRKTFQLLFLFGDHKERISKQIITYIAIFLNERFINGKNYFKINTKEINTLRNMLTNKGDVVLINTIYIQINSRDIFIDITKENNMHKYRIAELKNLVKKSIFESLELYRIPQIKNYKYFSILRGQDKKDDRHHYNPRLF